MDEHGATSTKRVYRWREFCDVCWRMRSWFGTHGLQFSPCPLDVVGAAPQRFSCSQNNLTSFSHGCLTMRDSAVSQFKSYTPNAQQYTPPA